MGWLLSRLIFPVTFCGCMGAALLGIAHEVSYNVILAGITLATILVVAIFERVLPEHEVWNESQQDVQTDLLHGAVSIVVLPKILDLGLHMLLLNVAVHLSELLGFSLWPSDWPVLAQLIRAGGARFEWCGVATSTSSTGTGTIFFFFFNKHTIFDGVLLIPF